MANSNDLFRMSTKQLKALHTPEAKAELERRIAKRAANPAKAKGTVLNGAILSYTKGALANWDAPGEPTLVKPAKAAPKAKAVVTKAGVSADEIAKIVAAVIAAMPR